MKKPPPLKTVKTVSALALGALLVFLVLFYYANEVKTPADEAGTEPAPAQTESSNGDPHLDAAGQPRGHDSGSTNKGRPSGHSGDDRGSRR